MGITVHIFTRSLLESIYCVALVVCMSSDRNRCVNNEALERDPVSYSHLHTAGQSCGKVDMNVGLFVSESYRNGQTQVWGEGGFPRYSIIGQVLLTKNTGPLKAAAMRA